MFKRQMIVLCLIFGAAGLGVSCGPGKGGAGGPFAVTSPDGNVVIAFRLEAKPQPYLPGERAYYRVAFKGAPILDDSPLGLDFLGTPPLDRDFEVVTTDRKSNDSTWENPFGAKRTIPDRYNELTVSLREKKAPGRRMDIVFRAYDEGAAFRYVLPKQDALGEFTLAAENTGFYFAGGADAGAGGPYVFALNMGRMNTQNEGEYPRTALRDIKPASVINLPLLVEMPVGGPWAALLEADLTDYAGMYVSGVPGIANALAARLSTPPARKSEEAVVGKTPKATPWRVLMVAATPGRLIETNYLPLNLSAPCAIADTSWIKPGKAAWDWWSGNWAKGVKVLLWVEWRALDARMDEAMALYEKWGAAGIKVDYMNRDDQDMVNYYERVVRKHEPVRR